MKHAKLSSKSISLGYIYVFLLYAHIQFLTAEGVLFVKKFVLRSLTVSALSLAGSTAFAQENTNKIENQDQKVAINSSNTTGSSIFSQDQIDALKKEMEKKDVTENKVTFAGVVQLNANTSDTQRASSPDFQAAKVRLGANVSGGIASGQIEIQLRGNQQSTQTVTSGTTSEDQGNGQVTLRRAQLNLDVLTLKGGENTYTTTISLGGIRIGGADGNAPDAAWLTTGFGRQDGAYLKEALVFGKTANLEIGFGAFNNILAAKNATFLSTTTTGYGGWGGATIATKQANWGSTSFSQSIGYAGHLAGTYNIDNNQSLALKAYYGTQGNAPSKQNADGDLATANDVSHIEASLVYNHANILGTKGVISGNGVNFWYENESIGKTKNASKNGSGDFNYTSGTDDSQNVSLYGIGVAADSGSYLTGMIQKGDRLTYALAYVMLNSQFGSSATSQDYNANQYTASVGYAVNTFEAAFNVEFDNADTNIFTDSKNNLTTKKNAVKSYLTAYYTF